MVTMDDIAMEAIVLSSRADELRYADKIYLDIGGNIGKHVRSKIMEHFGAVNVEVNEFSQFSKILSSESSLVIALGNSSVGIATIPSHIMTDMPDEGFVVYHDLHLNETVPIICSNGRPMAPYMLPNSSVSKDWIHYGAVAGAYAVLEQLGFGFMHPLSVQYPKRIVINMSDHRMKTARIEKPYWPERNFHIHTQHPLELTEVLQGMDVPMGGPLYSNCSANLSGANPGKDVGIYCERWEDMVPDVDMMFQWSVANRLNKVEWMLLGNYKWGTFDASDMRQKRLRLLTSLGHDYGLLVGADVPLGNTQQHAWSMVNTRLPFHKQVKQIHKRVDWVFNAGFDFLSTESGMSEFTHPDCSLMLDLLNEYARYVNITWGREASVKVHCSTGQVCQDHMDPRTGDPINFNFLPAYAHSSLGVMPHTVQVYGLDDPVGGAYGNKNFKDIEDYMLFEASRGNRSVVFYGETAYWVSVDVDVPLFLPLYGQRRLHDLRRIAHSEKKLQVRIQGQMNFDSGWEWAYWLNNVVTARASWDPFVDAADDWEAFAISLEPFCRLLGPIVGKRLLSFLVTLTKDQWDLLIYGRVKGMESVNLDKLSGIAYLSGSDTWYDLPRMFGLKFTQPDKVHMDESGSPLFQDALVLLREMEAKFSLARNDMEEIYALALQEAAECDADSNGAQPTEKTCYHSSSRNVGALVLVEEINDAVQMLAMRAKHVRLLYESSDADVTSENAASLQGQARAVLHGAAEVVQRRESQYRVPWQRIASWRENPTVYRFGYVWAVHSLYYWWRDQGLCEKGSLQSQLSPCYLNRMDASETVVGWGKTALEFMRYMINTYSPFSQGYPLEIINCIAPPSKEYSFPDDLYHHF